MNPPYLVHTAHSHHDISSELNCKTFKITINGQLWLTDWLTGHMYMFGIKVFSVIYWFVNSEATNIGGLENYKEFQEQERVRMGGSPGPVVKRGNS